MSQFISYRIEGLDKLKAALTLMPKQFDIALQRTLIKTAQAVVKAEQDEMGRVFDRPTRFTLGALTTKFNKPAMTATVEVKDGYWSRSNNYLATQIHGGDRHLKAFERALQYYGVMPNGWLAVPGRAADLDAFGNMKPSQIRQILSWFDAAKMVEGSDQNMGQKGRDKRRKGTKTKRGFEYFVAQPGYRMGRGSWKNGKTQNLTPGIYKRTSFGFGKAIQPIIIFVRSTTYAPRFRFYEVARKTSDRVMPVEFNAALKREMASL